MSTRHLLRIALVATCATAGAVAAGLPAPGTALAQQQASRPQTTELPTVEDILRRATPQGGQQAAPPAPGNPLPTIGDIASRAAAQAPVVSCQRPPLPGDPPDGRKATEEEMRKADAAFRAYVKAGQEFQECVDRAQREALARLTVLEFLTLEQLIVQMQASIEIEAARYNEQVRAFRAR